jgi:hypothetical protein
LTYLSVLAGLGYVSYQVYDLRHPSDQVDPDPSKKTLVILGLSLFLTGTLLTLTLCRYRLGLRISPEKAGH